MKEKLILFQLCFFTTIFISSFALAVNADDLLITDDIGAYKYYGSSGGQGSGTIAATGHFDVDHLDYSFTSIYFHDANEIGVNLEVTQHTGDDSDQWLLHEIERQYRNYFGIPSESVVLRNINGNTILVATSGGGLYSWLSNNNVIVIKYHDLQLEKPEPQEVVTAYLGKFPSSLPALTSAELRTNASKEKWIKDEMDRRLWLGDKWFAWQAAQNSEMGATLREVNRSLTVFLDYREKFYSVKADTEKETLFRLQSSQNVQGMKDKLTEYKTWWAANKSGSINLP
jgi:hypothetical protein